MSDQLMLSAEDFPAKISPSQGMAPVLKASAVGYGEKSPVWFASFDQGSYLWRTSQLSLVEGLTVFSETWPRSGIAHGGDAFELPTWEPPTDATASGLWPTPNIVGYRSDGELRALATLCFDQAEYLAMSHRAASSKRRRWWRYAKREWDATLKRTGELNPEWVGWLMGFPIGWASSAPTATPSSPKSPN